MIKGEHSNAVIESISKKSVQIHIGAHSLTPHFHVPIWYF